MRRRFFGVVAGLLLAGVAIGCGSGGLQLPTDPAGTALFEQAEKHTAAEEWNKAATAYDTLLRNYPTSPYLPEARLGLGVAYYEQGRSDRALLAIEAFRNFLTYHPSHERVDFAQLMIALSYTTLMRSPDRDQSNTRRAVDEFDVFLEDYPNSGYREMATERRQEAIDTIAQHELQVAEWQLARGYHQAAEARAQYALRKYPSNGYRCQLLYTLAESLRRRDEGEGAVVYYDQILREYPNCEYADEARSRAQRVRETDGR